MLELKDYTINDLKTIFGTRKRDNKSYVDIWKEKYPIFENNDVFKWIIVKMKKFAQKPNKEPRDFNITSYINPLQKYCDFNNVSNPSELLKENIDNRNKRVVDYLVHLINVEKKNAVSVKNAYQSRIKSFYSARGSPITDGLETENEGLNHNEMNLNREKIQAILNMINNSNYKLTAKTQALLGLRIGDVLKELPKYKIFKHKEHFYIRNFLTIKENVRIKYVFFPNELTKLLQSIYQIEDLRKLDLSSRFLKTRKSKNKGDKVILSSEYLRKLKVVTNKVYPNEVMRSHSFRKYFATQISRVNLTKIRNDIGSDVESNFKEHLLGHKVHYSTTVYNQILNDINQFYELWKPLEASLCIDCEIVNTTNQDILKLKEENVKLEEQINTLLKDSLEMKRVLVSLFTKAYDIDDLDDLISMELNTVAVTGKTEKEVKEQDKRDNAIIDYIIQINKDLK